MEKQKTAILLDKEYLHKLKDDVNSCVEAEKAVKHLSLHPFQLIDESAAIKDVLNKGVGKYDKKLNGILLGHEDITLLNPVAFVPADSCFPHFDVEANFFIFRPMLDKVLVGVVNKKSKDHVGCLVHKVFNVSLPKPKDEKNWIGSRAEIGQEVEFKIIFTDFNGKLPYIRGEILSIVNEDSGFSGGEDQTESKPNSITKFDDSDNEEEPVTKKRKRKSNEDEEEGEPEVSPKKKKKKQKHKDTEGLATEEFTLETPTKKKKHKDASRKIEFPEVDTTVDDMQCEEMPTKKPKKHKKKIKDEST